MFTLVWIFTFIAMVVGSGVTYTIGGSKKSSTLMALGAIGLSIGSFGLLFIALIQFGTLIVMDTIG